MTKRFSLISAVVAVLAFAVPAISSASNHETQAALHDMRGNVVKDARGNCVLTNSIIPGDDCGAVAEKAGTKLAAVYFDFNKATLTKKGRTALDQLLVTIKNKKIKAVTIAGYADAIGTDSYNLTLSEKRAKTVQAYLKANGFTNSNTTVRALGKAGAGAKCKALKGEKLRACMQEDRRVDIELSGVSGK